MKRLPGRRVLPLCAAMLCLMLAVSYLMGPVAVYANDYQAQINALNDKKKQLEQQQKEIQNSIASAQTEREKEQQTKYYLDQQISLTSNEIATLEEKIDLLERDIEEKQRQIELKQAEHNQNYELFLRRIKAMYMYDDSTTLGLVLGADSFVDFLTRTDTVVRVADHDRELLARLNAERQALERDQDLLEQDREALQQTRQETEEKKSTLTTQQQAAALRIQDISEMERQYTTEMSKVKAEMDAASQEINDLYAKMTWGDFEYNGVMAWPVTGYHKISSDYGWRFGGSDYHTGIDIAGGSIYGQPIRAASNGQIKLINYTSTPGRGYGIYVILDHGLQSGNSVSTLYAHMSKVGDIKVDGFVSTGDVIGYVGSTGWSTGPHLHFEVRINGKSVDPKPYIM